MRLVSAAVVIALAIGTPVAAAPPPPAPVRPISRGAPSASATSYEDAMHEWTLRRNRLRAGLAVSVTAVLAGALAIGIGIGIDRTNRDPAGLFEPHASVIGLATGVPLVVLGVVGAAISGDLWEQHSHRRPTRARPSLRPGGLSLRF